MSDGISAASDGISTGTIIGILMGVISIIAVIIIIFLKVKKPGEDSNRTALSYSEMRDFENYGPTRTGTRAERELRMKMGVDDSNFSGATRSVETIRKPAGSLPAQSGEEYLHRPSRTRPRIERYQRGYEYEPLYEPPRSLSENRLPRGHHRQRSSLQGHGASVESGAVYGPMHPPQYENHQERSRKQPESEAQIKSSAGIEGRVHCDAELEGGNYGLQSPAEQRETTTRVQER